MSNCRGFKHTIRLQQALIGLPTSVWRNVQSQELVELLGTVPVWFNGFNWSGLPEQGGLHHWAFSPLHLPVFLPGKGDTSGAPVGPPSRSTCYLKPHHFWALSVILRKKWARGWAGGLSPSGHMRPTVFLKVGTLDISSQIAGLSFYWRRHLPKPTYSR